MSKKKNQLMTAKKIGANLSVTISGTKYGKRVTKEEATTVLKSVENYNKAVEAKRAEKTIAKWEKQVVDFMTANTKKKLEKKAQAKDTKKAIRKRVTKTRAKTPSPKAIKEESGLLKDLKKNVNVDSIDDKEVTGVINWLKGLLTKGKNVEKPKAKTGARRSGEY